MKGGCLSWRYVTVWPGSRKSFLDVVNCMWSRPEGSLRAPSHMVFVESELGGGQGVSGIRK